MEKIYVQFCHDGPLFFTPPHNMSQSIKCFPLISSEELLCDNSFWHPLDFQRNVQSSWNPQFWSAILIQLYQLERLVKCCIINIPVLYHPCFTAPLFLLYNNVYAGGVLHYTLASPGYHDGCEMSGMRLWGWSGRHGMWQKHSLTIRSWWVNQVFIHSEQGLAGTTHKHQFSAYSHTRYIGHTSLF